MAKAMMMVAVTENATLSVTIIDGDSDNCKDDSSGDSNTTVKLTVAAMFMDMAME